MIVLEIQYFLHLPQGLNDQRARMAHRPRPQRRLYLLLDKHPSLRQDEAWSERK